MTTTSARAYMILTRHEYGKVARQCAAEGQLTEARDEKRLQRRLAAYKLLIANELGFQVFSQRYERGSTIVTANLPFGERTGAWGT